MFKTLLEIIRIILISALIGGFIWAMISTLYNNFDGIESYTYLGGIATLIIVLVLYRNKLQFSGWYDGEGREKLTKKVTFLLILCAFGLFIAPILLSLILI